MTAPILYNMEREYIDQAVKQLYDGGASKVKTVRSVFRGPHRTASATGVAMKEEASTEHIGVQRALKASSYFQPHVNYGKSYRRVAASAFMIDPLFFILHAEEIHSRFMNSIDKETVIVMTEMICIMVCISAGILLFFHTYLISTAQTTLELFESFPVRQRCKELGVKYYGPYDQGNTWENFRQVLGEEPLLAVIFLSVRKPLPVTRARYQFSQLNNIR